jgi:GNAT superfamily N-acetyltransferase
MGMINMAEIKIRDFTESDRADYFRMSKLFYSSNSVLHPAPEENFSRTFDQCVAGGPYTRGLMLLLDEEIAGYALLSFTWSNEAGGLCVLLEEAYVLPDRRGMGIGSALLRHVEKEYQGSARRFRLEVTSSNSAATRLYERMGYSRLEYLQMVKDVSPEYM